MLKYKKSSILFTKTQAREDAFNHSDTFDTEKLHVKATKECWMGGRSG